MADPVLLRRPLSGSHRPLLSDHRRSHRCPRIDNDSSGRSIVNKNRPLAPLLPLCCRPVVMFITVMSAAVLRTTTTAAAAAAVTVDSSVAVVREPHGARMVAGSGSDGASSVKFPGWWTRVQQAEHADGAHRSSEETAWKVLRGGVAEPAADRNGRGVRDPSGEGSRVEDEARGLGTEVGGEGEELDVLVSIRAQEHNKNECKFIIVTGGVLSGIGKGVTASSIGVLCKMMGLRPTAIKIDPYLNVDAGTMSPFEHGEVFVLDDGGETDLDLGNYERFMGVNLRNESNLTTGKIYQYVIEKERRGDYLGKTVQVVPQITDALQEWIMDVSRKPVDESEEQPNVCIIELGGTLGDIESMPFVEALRQLQGRVGYKNCCFVHVSLVPELGSAGEQKTKPTQHSVKQMRALGLAPDFLMCRGRRPVVSGARQKLAMFCQVPPERVVSVHDVSNIYHVPLLLLEQNFPALLAQRLRMGPRHSPQEASNPCPVRLDKASLERWEDLARRHDEVSDEAVIGLVGKYTELHDTYLSVVKALLHASLHCRRRLTVKWIDSCALDKEPGQCAKAWEALKSCHGVLVPGGFGSRGLEGKIQAIKYARENRVPFLGICLGMQAAVIEYARSQLGRTGANSAEFAPNLTEKEEVVVFMPEGDRTRMGGTMRLGSRATLLRSGSRAFELYGGNGSDELEVHERHRHRYEVNPAVVEDLESAGLKLVGRNKDGDTGERMEVLELSEEDHPYFMGAQYHPEFKSRPGKPSPLFTGLLQAAGQFADQSESTTSPSAEQSDQ